MMIKQDLLIIGAGLSGIYTAYLLQDKYNITIIEARPRIGGRIVTIDGNDLGPSWVWMHHTNIIELINELNLELFPQYTKGLALYEDRYRIEKFKPQEMMPSYRIDGGIYKIIDLLVKRLNVTFCISEEVQKITELNNVIKVTTSKNEYITDYVISTIPPRLVAQDISFSPTLDISITEKFNSIFTWMAHCTKYIIEYDTAFWKEHELSGFGISHVGPITELQDASTKTQPALLGFVHRNIKSNDEDIKNQLIRLFGAQAKEIKKIHSINWNEEKYTATPSDKRSEHPDNRGMIKSIYNNRVKFIGTETSSVESGYLEGAIISALEISNELKD